MKKVILIILSLITINLNAATNQPMAALSPFYQSTKEIKAILNDKRLAKELGSSQILEIKKEDDGYLIYSSRYVVKVEVKYQQTKVMGPSKFGLEFHKKQTILF